MHLKAGGMSPALIGLMFNFLIFVFFFLCAFAPLRLDLLLTVNCRVETHIEIPLPNCDMN